MKIGNPKRTKVIAIAVLFGLAVLLAFLAVRGSVTGARAGSETSSMAPGRASRHRPQDTHGATHEGASPDSPWVIRDRQELVLEGVALVDGAPTAGVAVRLEDATRRRVATPPRTIRSGPDGRFRLDAVAPIREYYRIVATGPNLSPDWEYVPGDASKNDIVLGLRTCALFAYGTIRDASGGALEGAQVYLDTVPEHAVTTDSEGRYRLCLPEKTALIRVAADGYGTWSFRSHVDGSERHDGTLMPEGSIEGIVVLSEDGSPVPNATVSLWSGERVLVDEVLTGANGRFVAEHLAPGVYDLRARAPRARFRQPVRVSVHPGEIREVVVPIDSRVRVSGMVRAGQMPVAGAHIHMLLNATEQSSAECTTDTAGQFILDDVPIGTANVRVRDHEVLSPFALHVPEEGLDGITVLVESHGRLDVTVLHEGRAVHGALVRATSTGHQGSSTRSDGRGVASLRGLGEGIYRVRAEHRGTFATADDVAVEHGQRTAITVELTEGITIHGEVVDTEGVPVDGARVYFIATHSSEDVGASTVTGADGAFRGGPLFGPATYRLSVALSGVPLPLRGNEPQIRVAEDGTPSPSRVRLVVDRQDHTLTGTVVNVDGLPVADTRVSLFPEVRHTDAVNHTYTGSDGAFMLRDLGVGPFRVTAVAPSGSETELGPLSLPHTPLRIVLGEVGTLRGTLEGFRTTPTVMAWTRRGYDWESLHYATVEGSRFAFGGLAPDHYYVAASSNDQATTVEVSVTADTSTEVILVASTTRTVRGRLVDLITGRGLAGSQCQAAPYIEGTRSPVVVPGAVRTDESGVFEFRDVPASDLYAWCLATETARGGVGRIPADLRRGEFTIYGLDVTGRPALDVLGLGFDFDGDRPFSHAVLMIEPGGPAARSGLEIGDIIVQIGATAVAEVGNGTVRNYLALLLTEESRVPLVVVRGETLTELGFRLAH